MYIKNSIYNPNPTPFLTPEQMVKKVPYVALFKSQ